MRKSSLSPEPNPTQVEALRLAKLGFPVAPAYRVDQWGRCGCGNRRCPLLGAHAPQSALDDATTDPDRIRQTWPSPPPRRGSNLLVPTGGRSGFVALRIRHSEGGPATLAALERRYGPLPPTATCEVLRLMTYLIFKLPASVADRVRRHPGDGVYGLGNWQGVPVPPTRLGNVYPVSWTLPPEEGIAEAQDWVLQAAGYYVPAPPPLPLPPPPPLPLMVLEIPDDPFGDRAPAVLPGPSRSTRYGLEALRRESETIRLCGSVGGAAVELSGARLFRLVTAGHLALHDLRHGLLVAGRKAGLVDAVTLQAIEDGLRGAQERPARRSS